MRGQKTGGRKPGTPNRRTFVVEEKLEAMGCEPIEGMAKIAMDTATPLELRASLLKELAQYVYPKRKAIEIDAPPAMQTWAELVRASLR